MDLSILLVQYRPDEGELRRTLASLLRQSCRDFELVVADDGSDEDFFPLTRKILAENGFTGAKFVKLTPNGGTVKNVLNGAKQAAGKWVFTVSPGDYLYDADTVAWLLALFVLFVILYMAGIGQWLCIAFGVTSASVLVWLTFYLNGKFGEHGLMKLLAKKQHPRYLINRISPRKLFTIKKKNVCGTH